MISSPLVHKQQAIIKMVLGWCSRKQGCSKEKRIPGTFDPRCILFVVNSEVGAGDSLGGETVPDLCLARSQSTPPPYCCNHCRRCRRLVLWPGVDECGEGEGAFDAVVEPVNMFMLAPPQLRRGGSRAGTHRTE